MRKIRKKDKKSYPRFFSEERLSPASLSQFTNVRVITFCGMMGALAVILSTVATIRVGDFLRIGFSNIPNQIVAFLFGPWVSMFFAGTMDIVKFIVHPDGAFNFAYTFIAMVGGLIYGFFLYKRKISVINIFLAEFFVKVICNLFMNSFMIIITTGKAFNAIMPARILSNAGKLPCDIIIMLILLPIIDKVIRPELESNRRRKKETPQQNTEVTKSIPVNK